MAQASVSTNKDEWVIIIPSREKKKGNPVVIIVEEQSWVNWVNDVARILSTIVEEITS